jgi:hypothetical protein
VQHIAGMTGWAYREIMEELPFSAGLQLIDADLYNKGIERIYVNTAPDFDSLQLIEDAFENLKPCPHPSA